jgi:hypothetical protein
MQAMRTFQSLPNRVLYPKVMESYEFKSITHPDGVHEKGTEKRKRRLSLYFEGWRVPRQT